MPGRWGELGPGDRRVVAACATVALVTAIGLPALGALLGPQALVEDRTHVLSVSSAVLGQVPVAAALVAVVLTRLPLVGVTLAVTAALASSLVGLGGVLGRGPAAYVGLLGLLGTVLVAGLVVVADLVALRVSGFRPFSAATTGLGVAALLVAGHFGLLVLLVGRLRDELHWLAVPFLVGELPLRMVVLGLTGLVAGWYAARPRRLPGR